MIGPLDLLPHLVGRRLVSTGAVLDLGLTVDAVHRRNRNYRVQTPLGGTFLKQGGRRTGLGSTRNEALVYHVLRARGLGRLIPTFLDYDAEADVLAIAAVPDAVDLQALHADQGRFPAELGSEVGRALARLHRATPSTAGLEPLRPGALTLAHPRLEILRSASGAGLELIRVVQAQEGFARALERLSSRWRTASLVHGDIKLANLLATPEGGVRLIDFEFAGLGDPRWDVGCFLACYLTLWARSVPLADVEDPGRYLHLAEVPLDKTRPITTSFWSSYREAADLGPTEAAAFLEEALGHAAVYLVQTAYELCRNHLHLTTDAAALAQLGLNVLAEPEAAASTLLGIHAGS